MIVRDDLLGRARPTTPAIWDYQAMADADSMLNTPPTFGIYLLGKILDWVKESGGLTAMGERNRAKAEALYGYIDASDYYSNPVAPDSRSWMNVPFLQANPDLDKTFVSEASAAGLTSLAGHRSVGGMRASIYNAMPLEGVQALIDFMTDFERRNGEEPDDLHDQDPQRDQPHRALNRLPKEEFEVSSEVENPDAIMLRSASLHGVEIPASVLAVARAGAGTNNIPIAEYSAKGIPVFNTPGANANAVKELVLAALFLAARNIVPAATAFAHTAGRRRGQSMDKAVEAGKKAFVGFELPGRTLGVIGLGAIGVEVANAAVGLGMRVHGLRPRRDG